MTNMKRRGLLVSMFAAAAAPAIVRAESLMRIVPTKIWTPPQGIVTDSFVEYVGNGSAQTIHHSIGYAPQFIMIKSSGGSQWQIHHAEGF